MARTGMYDNSWRMVTLASGETDRIAMYDFPRILFVTRGKIDVVAGGLRSRKSRIVAAGRMALIHPGCSFKLESHGESTALLLNDFDDDPGPNSVLSALLRSDVLAYGSEIAGLLAGVSNCLRSGRPIAGLAGLVHRRLICDMGATARRPGSSPLSASDAVLSGEAGEEHRPALAVDSAFDAEPDLLSLLDYDDVLRALSIRADDVPWVSDATAPVACHFVLK